MSDYKIEFPDFPAEDMPAVPEGFTDESWHNDACPVLGNEDTGLYIWIEYSDDNMRENGPDGGRFILEHRDEDGDPTTIIETDEWQEVLDAIAAHKGK